MLVSGNRLEESIIFFVGDSLRWDSSGTIVAGNTTPGSGPNQITTAHTIFVDSHDALYISNTMNQRIQQYLPNSVNAITVAGVTGICT